MFPYVESDLTYLILNAHASVPAWVVFSGYRVAFFGVVVVLALVTWGLRRWGRRLLAAEMTADSDVRRLAKWLYRVPLITISLGVGFAWFLLYTDAAGSAWPYRLQFWTAFGALAANVFVMESWRRRRGKRAYWEVMPYAVLAPTGYYLVLMAAGLAAVLPIAQAHNAACRDRAGVVLNEVAERPISIFFNESKVAYSPVAKYYDDIFQTHNINQILEPSWSDFVADLEVYTEGADQLENANSVWYINQPGYYRILLRPMGHPDCMGAPYRFDAEKVDPPYPFNFYAGEWCLGVIKLDKRQAPYRYVQQPSARYGERPGELEPIVAEPLPEGSTFDPITAGIGLQVVPFYQALVHDPYQRVVAEARNVVVAYPLVYKYQAKLITETSTAHLRCSGSRPIQGNRHADGQRPRFTGHPHFSATEFLARALDHPRDS